MAIFNFFGSILGYLLWFLYTVFKNYGVAIIFFTIILKIVMFPLNLKQQKSMAGQSKLSAKQKELQKKYANNKVKYNEELQKLYEKEGVSPGSSCITGLIPIPIMFGIYYSVIYPLKNTLHIAEDKITLATDYLEKIPGFSSTSYYKELEIIKNWEYLKDNLTMFDASDIEKIESFSNGFTFLGLDILQSPINAGFWEFLWIIPILSVISNYFMQFYMSKTSAVQQTGCMKYMLYGMPLLSGYWGFTFPAAVGLYWVVSSLSGGLQSVITHNFFSPIHLSTQREASRYVFLNENEKNYEELPLYKQNEIAKRLDEKAQVANQKQIQSNSNSSKKKSNKSSKNNDYLGNKK